MKKISTVAIERIDIFKEHQLTIGLDLGDLLMEGVDDFQLGLRAYFY